MKAHCWVDGQSSDHVSIFDRGLLYGDGFFTTVRVEQGKLLNWPAHRWRVRISLDRLGFAPELLEALEADLTGIAAHFGQGEGVLKCIVTRGDGSRGYVPREGVATRIVQFFPGLPQAKEGALSLDISPVVAMTQPQLAGIKHLCQLTQVLAARESGGREVLMLDEDQAIVGGLYSNVVFLQQRTLYTPRLDHAGVWGTSLRALQQVAGQLGYDWRKTRVSLGRACDMQGMALLNAVRGLRPVVEVGARAPCRFDPNVWQPLAQRLEAYFREQAWCPQDG
ncbi:aminotransferase class IV [Sulfurivirga sp.]|uniref:aminotransferase class IV n=1 Tax=Sulfurivirga sp. TaxID=2614236 RepID=UPI0025D0EEF9|nr:aminotransferase class IV [Sulfurivirga sp.]